MACNLTHRCSRCGESYHCNSGGCFPIFVAAQIVLYITLFMASEFVRIENALHIPLSPWLKWLHDHGVV